MDQTIPIDTRHLFPLLDKALISMLRSLSDEQWQQPTIARLWKVKDIAAHLLDGNARTLSFSKDHYSGLTAPAIHSYGDLVTYLNGLNAGWVQAMQRVSPKLLTDLLETTGKEFAVHMASLDPFGNALFSVAWAGETTSLNWFHIAREYTEKWIHQQQIRDALNLPGIMTRDLFYPFIDTFMYGLPYTYRDIAAPAGTGIELQVRSDIGGQWFLLRENGAWHLSKESAGPVVTTVVLNPDTAWRLFSKGISPLTARPDVEIQGDESLGIIALSMISVMA